MQSRLKGGWNVIGAVSQDAIQDASKVVQLNDFMWPARTILLIGAFDI